MERIELSTNRLCVPLQFSLPLSSLWSGLSLYPLICGYLPFSLYTFPRQSRTWLGITIIKGFPEFDRIYLPVTHVSSPFCFLAYLDILMVMNHIPNCTICQSNLSGKQKLFCSLKCKNAAHQSYPAQKKRGLKRKLHFVTLLGGKCSVCGYAKNLSGIAFHHLHGKEFQLDARSLANRNIGPILSEVKKCILLCHNCHAEIHNPNLDLAKLLIEPTALTTELYPHKTASPH